MNSLSPKIENKWVKINNNLSKKTTYMYIPSVLYIILVTVYINLGKVNYKYKIVFKRYMKIQMRTIDKKYYWNIDNMI